MILVIAFVSLKNDFSNSFDLFHLSGQLFDLYSVIEVGRPLLELSTGKN